jgi:ribosomal protein S18 acetylase RimI-like enzyme
MAISTAISRFSDYSRRHGLWATVRRIGVALKRALFSGRSILFYCDLATQTSPPRELPTFLKAERIKSLAELNSEDLEAMTSVWNPQLVRRNMKERFGLGASLWLIKSHDKLAGYGWTLQGRTVEPHYFPLGPDDVHLFDFHTFPQYRGQGMNPTLVARVLRSLAKEATGRALIEAAEWNVTQLSSLSKTPFRCLGMAKKWTIFGRTFVRWAENDEAAVGVSRRSLGAANGATPAGATFSK